jgi:hypothetical protein
MKHLGFWASFAAVLAAPAAHAQLMRLTIESHQLEAEFYDYDVGHTDWETTPHITHYRHPVDGTLFLQDDLDFRKSVHPDLNGIRMWGHAEGIGDFSFNFGELSLTPQPSGAIDLWVNTWLESSPDLNLIFGIRLNPDYTVDPRWGDSFELRNQGDGPGEFHTDSTLWAQLDRVTLTPVPEPSAYGAMASLALFGAMGWRARRRAVGARFRARA